MNPKILIFVLSWIATLSGLFLLSSPPPSPQTASILSTPASTPTPTLIPTISTRPIFIKKITPSPAPSLTSAATSPAGSVSPASSPSTTPSPLSSLTPLPTSTPQPIPTSSSSPAISPIPTSSPQASPEFTATPPPTAIPSPASQHTFYTSSHWKAKYYYCDTDNGWKDLSPTYLKSFTSEQELLANYSRILHKPCQD